MLLTSQIIEIKMESHQNGYFSIVKFNDYAYVYDECWKSLLLLQTTIF